MQITKRIAIVTGYSWGSLKPKEYEDFAEMLKTSLSDTPDQVNRSLECKIFKGKEARAKAIGWVTESSASGGAIVFLSIGAETAAKNTLTDLQSIGCSRQVKVVVLTGTSPEPDKVLYVHKRWMGPHFTLANIC